MPTVLLIDDDATNREPTGRLLRLAGYDVLRAANGRDGLDLLETCTPDVILLDLIMPEMDGLSFLKTLRSRPRFRATPVVCLTALSDGEAFRRSHKLGVTDYLVKSRFSPDELLATVRRQLDPADADLVPQGTRTN